MFKAINPFMDQTPTKILTRQYKVHEFSIVPGFATQMLSFPNVLLTLPAITKALSSFYYFRADLEISVKLNSTPYHQGMMQTAFIHDRYDSTATVNSKQQLSAMNAMYYNYSSSDSVTMQLGWLHPQVFMELPATLAPNAYLGLLFFDEIVPIDNTSGGSTTITCTVYARFLNPRTAGFRNQPPVAKGQASNVFKFNNVKETEEKSETGLPTSNTTDDIASPLFKAINLIPGTVSTVLDLFGHLSKMLDKPRDISNVQKMNYQVGEDMITGMGITQADRLTLYPTSKLADFATAMNCEDSRMPMAKLAQKPMLFDTFKFDSTHLVYNLYAHPMSVGTMGYTTISPTSAWAQPDYLATIASLARYWKGGIKYLLYFVTNAFTTARFRISYIIDYNETDLAYGGDFPSQIIDIKGSTICELMVPYLFNNSYKMTIPPGVGPGSGFQLSPKIAIELLSLPVASQGTAPYITCVIWRAAAEDFQIASLVSTQLDPAFLFPNPPEIVVQGQTSIDSRFSKTFEPINCRCNLFQEQGFTTTETIGTINDVLKRYEEMYTSEQATLKQSRTNPGDAGTESGSIVVGAGASVVQEKQRAPPYVLFNMFKYQRGGKRFRYLLNEHIPTENRLTAFFTPNYDTGAIGAGSGTTVWFPHMNPVYTVEGPWIGTVPYYPTEAYSIIQTPMQITEVSNSNLPEDAIRFASIADDRVLSYILPPATVFSKPAAEKTSKNTPTTKMTVEHGNTSNLNAKILLKKQ
jgi:hypothetical protein